MKAKPDQYSRKFLDQTESTSLGSSSTSTKPRNINEKLNKRGIQDSSIINRQKIRGDLPLDFTNSENDLLNIFIFLNEFSRFKMSIK